MTTDRPDHSDLDVAFRAIARLMDRAAIEGITFEFSSGEPSLHTDRSPMTGMARSAGSIVVDLGHVRS